MTRIDTYGRFSGFKVLLSSKPEMAQNSKEISHFTISEAVISRKDSACEWRSIPTPFNVLWSDVSPARRSWWVLGILDPFSSTELKQAQNQMAKFWQKFFLPPRPSGRRRATWSSREVLRPSILDREGSCESTVNRLVSGISRANRHARKENSTETLYGKYG